MTIDRQPGFFATIDRIRTILFAIFFACLGHGLLTYLVPIALKENGVSQTLIGTVLSIYSVGFFIGCFFGNKVISRAGHIRAYCITASLIAIAALLHSFYGGFLFTSALRFVTGIAMAGIYITLESWLNGASSNNTRATIFGVYQTAVAIGFSLSPWFLGVLEGDDPRQFSLVALMLAISLLPLAGSRRPSPQLPDSSAIYSFRRLFADSPSAVVGTVGAGLIALPATQLMIVFLADAGYSKGLQSLILSCAFIGSFLFQIPVGKLADTFDKRRVYLALLALLVAASCAILVNNALFGKVWALAASYLLFVGCCNCLHPLSVTLLFDQIDSKDAVSATSSMIVFHSLGLIFGPLLAGLTMEQFGSVMLYGYAMVVAIVLGVFLAVRIFVLRLSISQETLPYSMSIQNLRPSNINLNPRFDYLIAQIDDPSFHALVMSLSRADKSDYRRILADALFKAGLTPENTVLNLVLSLPRRSDDILKAMLALHPELREKLAVELHDLIALNKKRINILLLKGLNYKASRKQRQAMRLYFERSVADASSDNQQGQQSPEKAPS